MTKIDLQIKAIAERVSDINHKLLYKHHLYISNMPHRYCGKVYFNLYLCRETSDMTPKGRQMLKESSVAQCQLFLDHIQTFLRLADELREGE